MPCRNDYQHWFSACHCNNWIPAQDGTYKRSVKEDPKYLACCLLMTQEKGLNSVREHWAKSLFLKAVGLCLTLSEPGLCWWEGSAISIYLNNSVLACAFWLQQNYTNIERHSQIGLFIIFVLHCLAKSTCKCAGNNT